MPKSKGPLELTPEQIDAQKRLDALKQYSMKKHGSFKLFCAAYGLPYKRTWSEMSYYASNPDKMHPKIRQLLEEFEAGR